MSESLGWCVEAVRAAAEPSLSRALLALRARHTRRAGGPARFRERGGLGPLLALVGPERPRRVLELALSVLGNCCTEPGCRRQARSLGGVPRLVSILSVPGVPESVGNRVARTLANLALEPDGARDVLEAGAAPLLIALTSTCSAAGCLLSAARALRILSAPPRPPRPPQDPALPLAERVRAAAALSGRLSALGAADPASPALARALQALLLPSPCPAALAQAAAPAAGALVALAAHPAPDARGSAMAALAALSAHGALRPGLGAAGAVEAATEAVRRGLGLPDEEGEVGGGGQEFGDDGELGSGVRSPQFESGVRSPRFGSGVSSPRSVPALSCPAFECALRALCLLCREAVNRARVRRCGGLGALLGALRERRCGRCCGAVPLLARALLPPAPPCPRHDLENAEAASADWPRESGLGAAGQAAAGSRRGLRAWLGSAASPPGSPPPSPPPSPDAPSPKARPPLPPSLRSLALPPIPMGFFSGIFWGFFGDFWGFFGAFGVPGHHLHGDGRAEAAPVPAERHERPVPHRTEGAPEPQTPHGVVPALSGFRLSLSPEASAGTAPSAGAAAARVPGPAAPPRVIPELLRRTSARDGAGPSPSPSAPSSPSLSSDAPSDPPSDPPSPGDPEAEGGGEGPPGTPPQDDAISAILSPQAAILSPPDTPNSSTLPSPNPLFSPQNPLFSPQTPIPCTQTPISCTQNPDFSTQNSLSSPSPPSAAIFPPSSPQAAILSSPTSCPQNTDLPFSDPNFPPGNTNLSPQNTISPHKTTILSFSDTNFPSQNPDLPLNTSPHHRPFCPTPLTFCHPKTPTFSPQNPTLSPENPILSPPDPNLPSENAILPPPDPNPPSPNPPFPQPAIFSPLAAILSPPTPSIFPPKTPIFPPKTSIFSPKTPKTPISSRHPSFYPPPTPRRATIPVPTPSLLPHFLCSLLAFTAALHPSPPLPPPPPGRALGSKTAISGFSLRSGVRRHRAGAGPRPPPPPPSPRGSLLGRLSPGGHFGPGLHFRPQRSAPPPLRSRGGFGRPTLVFSLVVFTSLRPGRALPRGSRPSLVAQGAFGVAPSSFPRLFPLGFGLRARPFRFFPQNQQNEVQEPPPRAPKTLSGWGFLLLQVFPEVFGDLSINPGGFFGLFSGGFGAF
ncbi:armadillo repeat-containing protein 5 [Ammospiza maritima maritima]